MPAWDRTWITLQTFQRPPLRDKEADWGPHRRGEKKRASGYGWERDRENGRQVYLKPASGQKEDISSKKSNEYKELTKWGACSPRGGAVSIHRDLARRVRRWDNNLTNLPTSPITSPITPSLPSRIAVRSSLQRAEKYFDAREQIWAKIGWV